MTYTYRRSYFEKTKTIAVEGDLLTVTEEGKPPISAPLKDIVRVRIAYEPTRAQDTLYTLHLWKRGHSKPMAIVHSASFRGFMSFEDQGPAYREFAKELHEKLRSARGATVFEAGVGAVKYWLNTIFMFAMLALMAVVLLTIGQEIEWGGLIYVKLTIIAAMLPLGVAWVLRNRPRPYDPAHIPPELMPPVEANEA
jgi:hypothetical protein